MTTHAFTIFGMPRTKKTSGQGVVMKTKTGKLRAMMFPAKDYREWVKQARIVYDGGIIVDDHGRPVLLPAEGPPIGWIPISGVMNCRALFYLTNRQHGDWIGYMQGIGDFLQERGVIENDRLIVSGDGSRCLRDNERPRVEVVLEMVAVIV